MKVNFYENMKFNLLVVCLSLMVFCCWCYGYPVNENDARIFSSHNETQDNSSVFTSAEAWSKSQTEIMDGAIKVVRDKIEKNKNGSGGATGKNKIGTGGGSKTGKNKIGSGGGSKTGKDKIGSGGGRKTGKDKIGSGGGNKIGKNKIGTGGDSKIGKNKIGSGEGSKTGKDKIGSGGGRKTGKDKIGSGGDNKIGSVGGRSYHRYQYRNNNTTSYGSGPVPTYTSIMLIIAVGALFVGIIGYKYWHYINKSK
ncbi:hypothetical protein X975_00671, partial [Stegodyphus mimosarum]